MDMNRIFITLPDGNKLEFEDKVTPYEVALSIGERLASDSLVAEVDGIMTDMNYVISGSCELKLFTYKSPEALDILRHSTSHVMAMAVQELYPHVQVGIGPATDSGFYYDFRKEEPFVPEDLEKIEAKMKEIIKANIPFERVELSASEAEEKFSEINEDLKVELIREKAGDGASCYKLGDWMDFCRGPHIPSTGKIKSFKLLSIAGAYWRGDEKNEMLQRIYGTAFPDKKALKAYLHMLEEAKKRDHRKIGQEMELFSFHEEGPGFPFWHPKGTILYNEVVDYWRYEHSRHGYEEVRTPLMLREELWHRSGHWENYRDNMYFTEIDDNAYAVKPMNCPGGLLIYKSSLHSYRDLPFKMAEMGQVHRHEMSGVLRGLFRVRTFSIDDAHIFCTPDQMEDEVVDIIKFILKVYKTFGFEEVHLELSTRPDKSIGSDEVWEKATSALNNSLEKLELEYSVNEGDGAFYGPKIDFHIKDCLGRMWQCGTVQADFSMPERFELEYIGADDKRHTPVMIHRAMLGSMERFIGILTEHYAGDFPFWLAPEQVRVLPVSEKTADYGRELVEKIKEAGLRVSLDSRSEKIGFKIRDGELSKVPVMLIAGEREKEKGTVSVRIRKKGDLGQQGVDELIVKLKQIYVDKVIDFDL